MCGGKPCEKPNCTWSEQHRQECEARAVMRWPEFKRKEHYASAKKLRGEAAAKVLVAEVKRQWALKP